MNYITLLINRLNLKNIWFEKKMLNIYVYVVKF
jgi:hypothetical protein